jgi:3-hydroxy-9,10-secoandrosta-1,3,5(10)-triene-9,17-dione monooxygenase
MVAADRTPSPDATYGITDEFVGRLASRAGEAEGLRRLPDATVADLAASGFTDLLVPKRLRRASGRLPGDP